MGKVILVTGGSRGLGAGLVEHLARHSNSRIFFTFLNSHENAAQLVKKSNNIESIQCDQKDEKQIMSCLDYIIKKHGRLDALVNNACSAFTPSDFLFTDWDRFQDLIDTNVKGAFLFTREASRIMKNHGGGRIINILSSYILNIPPEKLCFYITAKYALLGLTRSSAVELSKYGITVNAVSPGLMATDLSGYLPPKYMEFYRSKHPMKHITEISDTAGVVDFLMSEGSKFLNGVNIPVCGGESF